MRKLENCSNFTKQEIELLQGEFKKTIEQRKKTKHQPKPKSNISVRRRGTVYLPENIQQEIEGLGDTEIGLAKPEFMSLIQNLVPSLADSAEGLFDQFDEDRSGYLDFREFTICISVLSKGSFEDKLHLCFDAFDTDHTGTLHPHELNLLIEKLLTPYLQSLSENFDPDLKRKIEEIYDRMTKLIMKSNDAISYNDFYNSIIADPLLFSCLSEHVGSSEKKIESVTEALAKSSFAPGLISEDKYGHSSCSSCLIM